MILGLCFIKATTVFSVKTAPYKYFSDSGLYLFIVISIDSLVLGCILNGRYWFRNVAGSLSAYVPILY